MSDVTPKYHLTPLKESVVLDNDGFGQRIGGIAGFGGTPASAVNKAINEEGDIVTDLINDRLDTSAQQILGNFVFGSSGAIKMITDENNGLWFSPTGILAKKLGANTLTVTNEGDVTMIGTITASAGSIGGWNISATALYYDGSTDALSAGMASVDYPFYAGKKYADRATAPFRITPAGVLYASSGNVEGDFTIGGRLATVVGGAINSDGDFINDVINTNLNTNTKKILADFTLEGTNYAGALKAGTITWNTTTGRVSGGTGFVINDKGILGALSGVEKITILNDGTATFAGTLSAASGTLGAITIGSNAWHVDSSGNMWWGNYATYALASIKISSAGAAYLSSATITGTINATAGKFGSANNYWSVGSTGLTAVSADGDVIIKYGKTDFGQDSTAGFIFGYDYSATKSKFEMGSSATKIFKYDGTDISLIGGTITGGVIQTASSGGMIKLSEVWADSPAIDFLNGTEEACRIQAVDVTSDYNQLFFQVWNNVGATHAYAGWNIRYGGSTIGSYLHPVLENYEDDGVGQGNIGYKGDGYDYGIRSIYFSPYQNVPSQQPQEPGELRLVKIITGPLETDWHWTLEFRSLDGHGNENVRYIDMTTV